MNYDDLLWKCQGILGSQDYNCTRGNEMNLTDEEIEECIDSASRQFMRHSNSIRGQQAMPQDNYVWWVVRVTEDVVRNKVIKLIEEMELALDPNDRKYIMDKIQK